MSTARFDGFADAHDACFTYIYGNATTSIDYDKALYWCNEGHQADYNSSTTLLAELHYFGWGTVQDLDTALTLYEEAASDGHLHAQYMVFKIHHENPRSTPEQKAQGLEFLIEASGKGYAKAETALREYRRSSI